MNRVIMTALILIASGICLCGCSSLKIVEGDLTPPKWVADPAVSTNYQPSAFIYASGISTYSLVLEEGINDARHDAIRKIVERVGIAADDIYRTDRIEKRGTSQNGMPSVPQFIMNSHGAVSTDSNSIESKKTRNPQATHVSQSRLHGLDEAIVTYSVWQYGPSLWAKMVYGDTAIRFYDVYILMRCPKTEFEAALIMDRKSDDKLPEMQAVDADKK